MSSEMAPTEDSNAVMVNLNMPEGVTLTRTKRMADAFAEEVIALMDTNEYTGIPGGCLECGQLENAFVLERRQESSPSAE